MKLILITLVALVVGMMVACSSEPPTPAAPTATPAPAFSDAEVLGAVRGHLTAPGMEKICRSIALYLRSVNVRQDLSNRDKYYVTDPNDPNLSWTFIGSLGRVISTSKGQAGFYGC